MKEEQIYNPVAGINQMITDIESFVNPMIFRLQPVIRLMGMINIYLVIAAFSALLCYLIFIRKHSIRLKLRDHRTYIFAGVMIGIYAFLTETPIKLGPYINLNFALIAMPIFAKKMGPLMACIFGVLQYGTSFVMHSGEAFSLTTLLLAAMSGMLYGRFLYARKTTYIRCLYTKFIVNMVCNVLFVPMIMGDSLTMELANAITKNIVSNIVLVPLQALLIYAALSAYKKVEIALSED
ncbi:MAG: hypothetical protein IKW64_04390 [Clostridia bacterium]|nr:hypothetical protein [Clostridia bacterium]